MPEISYRVSVDPDDESFDPDDLQALIKKLNELSRKYGAIDLTSDMLSYQHPEWDWDSPCPECGSEEFHIGSVQYDVYHLKGENIEFSHRDSEGIHTPYSSVMCNNMQCSEMLYRSAISYATDAL